MKNTIKFLNTKDVLNNIKFQSSNKNEVINFNCFKTELYINILEGKFINKKLKYNSNNCKYDITKFKDETYPYKSISYSAIMNMAYDYSKNYYIPYGIIPDNWKSYNVLLMAGLLGYDKNTFQRYIFNEVLKFSMTSTIANLRKKELSILKNYKKFFQSEISQNNIDNLKTEWIKLLKSYQEFFNNNILQQILNNIYSESLQGNYLLINKEYNKIIENWVKYTLLGSKFIHQIEGVFDYDNKFIKGNLKINNPLINQLEIIEFKKFYIEPNDFIKYQCKKAI